MSGLPLRMLESNLFVKKNLESKGDTLQIKLETTRKEPSDPASSAPSRGSILHTTPWPETVVLGS